MSWPLNVRNAAGSPIQHEGVLIPEYPDGDSGNIYGDSNKNHVDSAGKWAVKKEIVIERV
jgi:hypothetical protein